VNFLFEDISKVIILSDMDGTLLTKQKTINETDLKAIKKFISMGGKFTVSTGRTIQSFEQYQKILDLKIPVVMYNGGLIYDYMEKKVLYSYPLDDIAKKISLEIFKAMPETGGEVLKLDDTYVFSNTEYQQYHTKVCNIVPQYMDLQDIEESNWFKVLFSMSPENIVNMKKIISERGFDRYFDFVRSSDFFLEMLPIGITKGSALNEYRKLKGYEDFDFVAIGDFDNDIEMIQQADFGVCPANSQESVKNTADMVLENTNNTGAVAELIEYIIEKYSMNVHMQTLKDYYDDIVKLSKVFTELGHTCKIESPATEQDILNWEKSIGYTLPSDYKNLLRLTKKIYVGNGYCQLYKPLKCKDDEICIGSVIGDGDCYYYNFEKKQFYREFESEVNLFDSFADLLENFYIELEMYADLHFENKWIETYDKMFPDK